MRLASSIVCVLLAFPTVAYGQNWSSNPGGGGSAPTGITKAGSVAYYDVSDTTDSKALAVGGCALVSCCLDPDEAGSNTGAKGYCMKSHENGNTAATSSKILADITQDGRFDDVKLNGSVTSMRECVVFPPVYPYIWIDMTDNPTPDAARWVATCLR